MSAVNDLSFSDDDVDQGAEEAMSREWVCLSGVYCVAKTDRAVRVMCSGTALDEWVPLSQVHDDSEVYDVGTVGLLIVRRWVCEQKPDLMELAADWP